MDDELFEDAKKRAEELKMNFSDYVRRCMIQDLYRKGPFVQEPMRKAPAPKKKKADV